MTVLVTVCMILLGVSAYLKLPVSNMPNVQYPVITISAAYPGASADTIARLVASPIEQEVMAIQGIVSCYSTNYVGQSTIIATFSLNRSMEGIVQDIQNALQDAQSNLPKDMPTWPTYTKTNPSEQPIIYISLTSEVLTAGQLYVEGAEVVQRYMQMVEGVGLVTIYGSPPAVRAKLNADKLAYLGMSLEEVALAIDRGNPNLPSGKLDGPTISFTLDPNGNLYHARQFEEIIVTYKNGAPVYLKDLGDVVDALQERDIATYYWSRESGKTTKNAIIIAVQKEANANTVKISQAIQDKMKELETILPRSINLAVLYDQSISIIASINEVQETLMIAFVLVVFVIFLFLARPIDTMVPVVALPMSILITYILMQALGFSLDNLSLLAIILAIGFVVDDAIVVLENTVRHIEEGQKPLNAALSGAKEITGTVISMSVSLIAVFIPLLFMPGVLGRMLREFSVTIVLAVAASGVVSLTLSPLMCSFFLKMEKKGGRNRLEEFIDNAMKRLLHYYGIVLKWFLRHKPVAILLWVACLAGTGFCAYILPKTFLPPGDSGALMGSFVGMNGSSPDKMKAIQVDIEKIIQSNPYVERTYTLTGATAAVAGNQGLLVAVLGPRDERPDIEEIAWDINLKLRQYIGARAGVAPIPMITFNTGSNSNTTGAAGTQYQFELSANMDLNPLYKHTIDVVEKLREIPGLLNPMSELDNTNAELKVNILRDQASALGVTAYDIEKALYEAYASYIASYIRTSDYQYRAIVETRDDDRRFPGDLSKLYIRSSNAGIIPITAVAELIPSIGPSIIKHKNQQNMTMINFALKPGFALGDATKAIQAAASKILPQNIIAEFSGDAATFQQTTADMTLLLVIAIMVMYMILGILYESYIQPLTVLSTLPVAGFGGFLTLVLFNSEFSFYAFVGFFLLLGIINKNGIMLVDFANMHRENEGCSHEVAIFEAAQARLRPILMTGFAAIMGSLPMAMGFGADGKGRMPMGLMIVGGLLFAQCVTLLVTPVIYLYFESMRDFFGKYIKRD